GEATMLRLPLHFALRKNFPGADTIIKRFNQEIKHMVALGTYNRILQLNWIASDVDGDGQPELVLNGDQAGTDAPENNYYMLSAPQGKPAGGASRYYIDGQVYDSWSSVPSKYKVPTTSVTNPAKPGFGMTFKL
ncbi:MAG TPA: hypothetical protein VEC93_25175, partial [Anaerolineae bacterium]|nr:hypothetical protein [Anaerolineae bacterium]